jgi:hypothetical protein
MRPAAAAHRSPRSAELVNPTTVLPVCPNMPLMLLVCFISRNTIRDFHFQREAVIRNAKFRFTNSGPGPKYSEERELPLQ